ncbi:helicase RepA family protein [Streptomyces africanus]|uniref:helicase RepA family protein n=1 Tax=Streptomyces africanus TaxID=231024 RepID=UPI001302BC20|nr:helicase RepA family protein [Streptomyces africanus]
MTYPTGPYLAAPANGYGHPDPDPEPWHEHAQDESQNPTQQRLAALRAALVDTRGLDSIPDPVALIDGLLFQDSLAWLYGKPGSGKSFVALDWAGCVAGGLPWNLRECSRGTVLYLVAEGASGIRRRVRAWEQMTGQTMEGVVFLPIAVQLLNGIDLAALVALATEMGPTLVVIDTQARVTVGAEENSSGEMGKVVAAADRIREASGACVLMVHHTVKNGSDMRGSSAFEGAATSIIRVTKDGDWIDVTCDKQKDAEHFAPIRLRMSPTDQSVTLVATGTDALDATPSGTRVYEALRDNFGTTSATGPQLQEVSGIPKSSFYRALNALVTTGRVRNIGTQSRPRYALPGNVAPVVSPTDSH